jgi:hypothetical protein
MGPNKTQRLKALALTVALCAGGVQWLHAQDQSRPLIDGSDLRQVSSLSTDNNNPVIAYSENGRHLFVAWDGLIKGERRIFLRERVAGEWLQPVVVDTNPAGENTRPSIALDQSGTPHLAWITTNASGQRVPAYARRLTRDKNSWYQQELPYPKESSSVGNCDVVNLQLDEQDRPRIAWQHGFGNVYNIAASHFNDAGEIISDDLTPGSTTHNLYPEVFFASEPTVYWYMWETDQFYLIASRYNAENDEWKLTPAENMELIPTSNLPDLFPTFEGPLAAIWYDRYVAEEDGSESDRIFLGLQDSETKGRGVVIGPEDGSSNDSVAAVSVNGTLVTAWVSETYETGAQVVIGIGDSPESIETTTVSAGKDSHNSNPKVSATASEAAVVWEQELQNPGDSAIVIRTAELD